MKWVAEKYRWKTCAETGKEDVVIDIGSKEKRLFGEDFARLR